MELKYSLAFLVCIVVLAALRFVMYEEKQLAKERENLKIELGNVLLSFTLCKLQAADQNTLLFFKNIGDKTIIVYKDSKASINIDIIEYSEAKMKIIELKYPNAPHRLR